MTHCHSNSSEKPSANAVAKNSLKRNIYIYIYRNNDNWNDP